MLVRRPVQLESTVRHSCDFVNPSLEHFWRAVWCAPLLARDSRAVVHMVVYTWWCHMVCHMWVYTGAKTAKMTKTAKTDKTGEIPAPAQCHITVLSVLSVLAVLTFPHSGQSWPFCH